MKLSTKNVDRLLAEGVDAAKRGETVAADLDFFTGLRQHVREIAKQST